MDCESPNLRLREAAADQLHLAERIIVPPPFSPGSHLPREIDGRLPGQRWDGGAHPLPRFAMAGRARWQAPVAIPFSIEPGSICSDRNRRHGGRRSLGLGS